VRFLCTPPWNLASEFSPKPSSSNTVLPSNHKIQSKCSVSSLRRIIQKKSTSQRITLFTSRSFTILSAYGYRKDERALPGNLQSYNFGPSPRNIIIIIIIINYSVIQHSLFMSVCKQLHMHYSSRKDTECRGPHSFSHTSFSLSAVTTANQLSTASSNVTFQPEAASFRA